MDLRGVLPVSEPWPVSWVDIKRPEQGVNLLTDEGDGVVRQGFAAGGSLFSPLEGCVAQGSQISFTFKVDGKANAGCLFPVKPGHRALFGPDNLAVSPREAACSFARIAPTCNARRRACSG